MLHWIKRKIKKYPIFYQKVWIACCSVPIGETRTYKWIAQKIGHPKAYRVVGTALSRNPLSPHIPCHRIIRSDGSLGGYSGKGGLARKRQLLSYEKIKRGRVNKKPRLIKDRVFT